MAGTIYTIGFTRSSAEHFFGRLRDAGVRRVLDIRLRPDSQLAGFARARDLPFLLGELCGAAYEHDARLAPDDALLDAYRGRRVDWQEFRSQFLGLMEERGVPASLDRDDFANPTALLCTEPLAEHCHRGFLADLLSRAWGLDTVHL